MKDLLEAALMMGGMLALALVVRVAAFVPLHSNVMAVNDPAPTAAADRGCGVMAVKMPCFRHANPEAASVPRQSGSSGTADAATITAKNMHCAVQQAKFPCLQHTDPRS